MGKQDARLRVVETLETKRRPALHEVPGPSRVKISKSVKGLTPYEAVSSQRAIEAVSSSAPIFKLDWNEATIPPSPKVQEAIAAHLSHGPGLNWYPALGSKNLLLALSDYTGLRPEFLLATNGSDDGLDLICASYLDEGDEVLIPVPTYNHFIVFAQSCGAKINRVVDENPFAPSLDSLHDKVTGKTKLIYLVSPNNPTGALTCPEEVSKLCEAFPETLIVLDEAYFEFAQVTGIDLVNHHTNLIVTRTFSKAFGLAGLRVGYLAAHPDIVNGLSRLYNPKSVNTLAQVGAMAALEDLDYLNNFLQEVSVSKEILQAFFETRPNLQAWVTPANFVVVRVPDIQMTLDRLESLGIFVRDRSNYPGLEGCLRMSVGTVEQTNRLIDRLSRVF